MFKTTEVLNAIAFILTVVLAFYGFLVGYNLVELTIYSIYFIVVIISQFINLMENS